MPGWHEARKLSMSGRQRHGTSWRNLNEQAQSCSKVTPQNSKLDSTMKLVVMWMVKTAGDDGKRCCSRCDSASTSKILRPTNHRRAERNDLSWPGTTSANLFYLCSQTPSTTTNSRRARSRPSVVTMASSTSIARLVAYRRPVPLIASSTASLRASFSSTTTRAATPAGPPQPGFRLSRHNRWDRDSESSLDQASKYFLMSELFRGMYVVLEQFFRPP